MAGPSTLGLSLLGGSRGARRAIGRSFQPNVSTLNPASQPSLTGPGLDLLKSLFGPQTNPLAYGGDVYGRLGSLFGQFGGAGVGEAQTGLRDIMQDTGQGAIDAYAPIFQRNLGLAREQGPRFSSGNALLNSQAMSDYNLFAAQTAEAARNRALQASLGLGNLSLIQGQGQNQILQQLLQALFQGGGISSAPIYNISPGIGSQLLSAGAQVAGAAAGRG